MTTDNICFYLQNRLTQTSQIGGQWYSDTSPFSIPWVKIYESVTGGLGDAADEDWRDGHDDAANGGNVGDQLGSGGALARQDALEVDLRKVIVV